MQTFGILKCGDRLTVMKWNQHFFTRLHASTTRAVVYDISTLVFFSVQGTHPGVSYIKISSTLDLFIFL